MQPGGGLRPGGLVPRRGSSFFKRQAQSLEGHAYGRLDAIGAEKCMQFFDGGVGALLDQLSQPLEIDLDDRRPTPRTR